jgi:hypothetical protein
MQTQIQRVFIQQSTSPMRGNSTQGKKINSHAYNRSIIRVGMRVGFNTELGHVQPRRSPGTRDSRTGEAKCVGSVAKVNYVGVRGVMTSKEISIDAEEFRHCEQVSRASCFHNASTCAARSKDWVCR